MHKGGGGESLGLGNHEGEESAPVSLRVPQRHWHGGLGPGGPLCKTLLQGRGGTRHHPQEQEESRERSQVDASEDHLEGELSTPFCLFEELV